MKIYRSNPVFANQEIVYFTPIKSSDPFQINVNMPTFYFNASVAGFTSADDIVFEEVSGITKESTIEEVAKGGENSLSICCRRFINVKIWS